MTTTREPRNPVPIPKQSTARVVLDWQAYFKEFCKAHGDWPIIDGGRLIFPDGWCYSSDDYSGPEFPPPTDPFKLAELLIKYWKRRRQIVTAERDKLASTLKSLALMQKDRPVALQQAMMSFDEQAGEHGRWRKGNQTIEWYGLSKRLEWLQEAVLEADRELRQLGER